MLNFNTNPYYDDFNEDKNFHRILFKPGVAVQARELSQLQTILQDQIGKFGKFVLSDGSKVSGGKYSTDTNAKSLDLAATGTISTDIEFFAGMYVVGETSRCVSLISSADILNYYIVVKSVINGVYNYQSGETLHIFSTKDLAYSYLNNSAIASDFTATLNQDTVVTINNCSGEKNSNQFTINSSSVAVGDVITAALDDYTISYIITDVGSDSVVSVNKLLQNDYNAVPLRITKFASRTVLEVNFAEGIYFTNNMFVKALSQSIVPNAKTQYPSCVIGFDVVETIVDFVDDTTLLDPAQGSYNYTAPGADRYKAYLNLVSKPLVYGTIDQTTLTTNKFIELLRIKDGIVISDNTDPSLGGLQDVLAKQLYDHAGNFIVTPFNITFHESNFSDFTDKLNCNITGGKAYINGYPYGGRFPTNITLDKARDVAYSNNNITNIYYGNSIRVSDVTGDLPIPEIGARIELHANTTPTAEANSFLGYAYVRNINYTTTNEYSLNLYNTTVSQQQIATVKSVRASGNTGFVANTILNSSNNTVILDTNFDKLIFKLPYTDAASFTNVSITLDSFDTIAVTSNVATIATGSLTKQFLTGTSAGLSTDIKNENFIIVTKNTNAGYVPGEYVDLANVTIAIEEASNEYIARFTFDNGYSGQIDIKYTLLYTEAQKKTKTLHTNEVATVNNVTTYPTSIGYSDVVNFKSIYQSPDASATYIGTWAIGTSYTFFDIVKFGDQLYYSLADSNSGNPPTTDSEFWDVLLDASSKYAKNNGQQEYMYDHATISALSYLDVGKVFVMVDYYSHSSTGQYIAYDSYPTAYKDIPEVKINNVSYALRDYVDFRPRRANANTGSSIITYDDYTIPTSITDSRLYYDMSYYLGRIDKLILGQDGKLKWIKGESSYRNYVTPKDEPNTMTVATVLFDPYSPDEQSIHINYAKHRRYTMDDIGNLDTRLSNVEYYTALSLSEKATLSTNIIDEHGTRLKNGFIVEPFTNFTIVDLSDNNKNISIDLDNNLARPSFSTKKLNVTATVDDLGAKSLIIENNLVRFNYTESILASQDQATSSVKINQFDAISYNGDLKLSPQSDVWTEELAPVVNNVSDDTAAISKANQVPGLVFNEWSTFYASHNYVVDKSTTASKVKYDNVNYSVSTATVTTTRNTEVNGLTNNIIPKSRSIPIKFTATGLAPLSKMFVYVNGHLVNAYVTPDENPIGMITSAQITYPGTGYASTANATSNTASIIPAEFSLSVVAGSIDSISILNPGKGYNTAAPISITINSATVSNTANVSLYTTPHRAMQLYTNRYGTCSGTLELPNSLVSFISGELIVMVCDTPHYDTENAISMAQATFYTKTTFTQKVTDSIRYPYISKVTAQLKPKLPAQDSYIVVPTSLQYLVNDYKQNYTATKTGTLSIPVYLNAQPLDAYGDPCDVVVTYVANASSDKSANTTISSGTSSLTFTGSNWKTPQTITFTYDLGAKSSIGDNKLPTYIEFYATSDDGAYNFTGEKPFGYWKSTSFVYGVATTKLIPYNVDAPVVVPPQYPTPKVWMQFEKPSISANGEQGAFFVYWSGDVGLDGKEVPNVYPLTFSISYTTSGYANTAIINGAPNRYGDLSYITSDFNSNPKTAVVTHPIRNVARDPNTGTYLGSAPYNKFDFTAVGKSAGLSGWTVTLSSANPEWNGLTYSLPFEVSSYTLPVIPHYVIVQSANDSQRNVGGSNHALTQQGQKTAINVSLFGATGGSAPTSNVVVSFDCPFVDGGGTIYPTYITFTPSNYANTQTIFATGSGFNGSGSHPSNKVNYQLTATTSSSHSYWNGLSSLLYIENTVNIAPPPVSESGGYAVYQGPNPVTVCYETGATADAFISLSGQPTENIVVSVGFQTSGVGIMAPVGPTTLVFTPSNWNSPQRILLGGASSVTTDKSTVFYLTTSYQSGRSGPWNYQAAIGNLTNKAVAVPQIFSLSYQQVQKSYSAQATGLPPANWKPSIGLSPSSADAGVSVIFRPVETTPTAAKFSVTGTFSNYSYWKGAALFTISAGADVDLSYTSGGVSGPLIPRNSTTLSPIKTGNFAVGYMGSSNFVSVNCDTDTDKNSSTIVYDFSGEFVISGLKRKTTGTGTVDVNVTETVVTYTTTKTYRADNYSLVETTQTSSTSTNIVSPTLNARSIEAAHNVLSAYPSLDTFGYNSSAVSKDKKDEDIKNIQAAQDSQRALAKIIEAKVFAAGGVNSAPASLVATYNAALAELTRLYGVETSRFYQN
jgi:hypothetical protein